jgi:6-phosphogluconolactonase
MRMKFNKSSQLLLVSAASLLVAGLVTACGTLTVDFVFVTSSKAAGPNNYGEIDVFEVNSESGFMRQIPTSPFPSGGRNPVAEAVSSDNTNLYVVNQDDNTIVQFIIGNDGKLYPQNTVNTPGIFPARRRRERNEPVYVVDTYQPLPTCSTAAPARARWLFSHYPSPPAPPSGALGSPIANGSLTYWPLSAARQAQRRDGADGIMCWPRALPLRHRLRFHRGAGYVLRFRSATQRRPRRSTAAWAPFRPHTSAHPSLAGNHPSASPAIPTSSYVYVTDSTSGKVRGYSVASGLLIPLERQPFPAGNQPSAIAVDPSYPYLYVANTLDSTVSAYSMSSGALTRLGTYATGLQPVAIGIDPSTNHFLYTANFLGSNVSGFELSTTAGTLINSQNSPYTANAQPTAVAAIPHNGTGRTQK